MPDHVQIPDRKPVLHLYGDGKQNEFPFDFPIFRAEDLWVWLDEKRQTDGYEVRGINQSSGGSVVFTIPPSSGSRITLHRQLRFERTSDFPADAVIRAKAINDEFDYQTACLQQLWEELERCPQEAVTSNRSTRLTWPPPQAGYAIGWSMDGKSLTNDPAQFAETVTAVKGYANTAKSAQDTTIASEQRAIAARDTAIKSETAAKDSQQMAQKWAKTPEDEEVITGEYSALHWAKKSEHFARNYPAATTEAAGIVKLATVEEVKEGTDTQKVVTAEGVAAAFNRIASVENTGIVKGGDNVDIAADGTLSIAQLGFTTMDTITTSRIWTAPKTGYYRVTCIGGGASGGAGGGPINAGVSEGKKGEVGGDTSFGTHLVAKGGEAGEGGGGFSYATGGSGGGAGKIVVKYVFLEKGEQVQILVGAGGPRVVGKSPYTVNSRVSVPPAGATAGLASTTANTNWNMGGNGAVTHVGFGGGGGGGGGNYGNNAGGNAKDGAENGGASKSGVNPAGYGGKGGDGAVIIEY